MRLMYENEIETVLAKYPQLIEDGLVLEGRQVPICGRRMDLVFKDANGRRLIVELKAVPLKDEHIGQIMAYEGSMLASSGSGLRGMLIGTKVSHDFRVILTEHKIEWREITPKTIVEFLDKIGDVGLLGDRRASIASVLESLRVSGLDASAQLLSEFGKKQQDYWKKFDKFVKDKGLAWRLYKDKVGNYHFVRMEESKFKICLSLNSPGNVAPFLCVSFWMPDSKDDFENLSVQKDLIEQEMGRPLFWDSKPGKKGASIWYTAALDYSNEKNWLASFELFEKSAPRLNKACNRYLI